MAKQTTDRGRRGHGEGSIENQKRADGRFRARLEMGIVDGKRKRKYVYGATKKEARQKLQEAQAKLAGGGTLAPEKETVSAYLERWLTGVKPSLRQSAYAAYELNVRRAKPHIGHIKLAKLNSNDLQAMYGSLLEKGLKGKPLSTRSVEQCHTVLHAAWKQAVAWNLMTRNHGDYVNVPRPKRKEMTTFSVDQVRILFDGTADQRLHALWVLFVTTGLRLGEATGLMWSDLDLKAGTLQVQRALQVERKTKALIFVEPKSEESRRSVELVADTVAVLGAHRKRHLEERMAMGAAWQHKDLVFCHEDGTPLHPRWVGDTWRRMLPKIGLPYIRLHDLRHTAASLQLQWGTHPKVVQEMLGHSTIAITLDLYSHVIPTMHREAASKFGQLFEPAQEPSEAAAEGS